MALSKEVRLLDNKWRSGQGWPKRLEWLEIKGLRGWTGKRIDFDFPITAIVGENGVGKSTVLQAAAAIYRNGDVPADQHYASDFFPDTPWEQVRNAEILASIREDSSGSQTSSVRKPTDRWRGNPDAGTDMRPTSILNVSSQSTAAPDTLDLPNLSLEKLVRFRSILSRWSV